LIIRPRPAATPATDGADPASRIVGFEEGGETPLLSFGAVAVVRS